MKRLGIGIVSIGILFLLSYVIWSSMQSQFLKSGNKASLAVLSSPVPTKQSSLVNEIEFDSIVYSIELFEITDIAKLRLIGNFSERKTAKQLNNDEACHFMTNGGFYSTENTPLGLFIGENYSQPKPLTSALLNGYVFITDTESIITSTPITSYRLAVQTGPLLIKNSTIQLLRIQNDTYERRMIAAVTQKNTLVFIMLYKKDSLYEGPLLKDIPEILDQISAELALPITNAINLDGGTASTFISPNTTIQELSPVGSVFCLSK